MTNKKTTLHFHMATMQRDTIYNLWWKNMVIYILLNVQILLSIALQGLICLS